MAKDQDIAPDRCSGIRRRTSAPALSRKGPMNAGILAPPSRIEASAHGNSGSDHPATPGCQNGEGAQSRQVEYGPGPVTRSKRSQLELQNYLAMCLVQNHCRNRTVAFRGVLPPPPALHRVHTTFHSLSGNNGSWTNTDDVKRMNAKEAQRVLAKFFRDKVLTASNKRKAMRYMREVAKDGLATGAAAMGGPEAALVTRQIAGMLLGGEGAYTTGNRKKNRRNQMEAAMSTEMGLTQKQKTRLANSRVAYRRANVFTFEEKVADVYNPAAAAISSLIVQPSYLFAPWVAQMSAGFQKYRFHQCAIMAKSDLLPGTSITGGVWGGTANYDVEGDDFTSVNQLESNVRALVSVMKSTTIPIECSGQKSSRQWYNVPDLTRAVVMTTPWLRCISTSHPLPAWRLGSWLGGSTLDIQSNSRALRSTCNGMVTWPITAPLLVALIPLATLLRVTP